MTHACEDANSKLVVEIVTNADVDAEKHVHDSWCRFGHKVKFLFRPCLFLVKILKLRFKRYFEAEDWSVFWLRLYEVLGRGSVARFGQDFKVQSR